MRFPTYVCPRLIGVALVSLAALATAPAITAVAASSGGQAAPVVAPKPSASIAISSRLGGSPMIGLPLDVIVSVSAGQDMSAASLTVATDDPLALIQPIDTVPLGDVAVGESVDVGVTVLPLVDQIHYLSVLVTGTIGGYVQSRSISVPIRLAGTSLRKAEDEVAGKNAERVRSFEAIETVR